MFCMGDNKIVEYIKKLNLFWSVYLMGTAIAGLVFPNFFYALLRMLPSAELPKEAWPFYVLALVLMALLGVMYGLNATNVAFTKKSVPFRYIAAVLLTISAVGIGYYGLIMLAIIDAAYALFVNRCIQKEC
jgi:hypothetical protein